MDKRRVYGTELEWGATVSAQPPKEGESFGAMNETYRKPRRNETMLWLARHMPTYVKRKEEFTSAGDRWYEDCEHLETSTSEVITLDDLVAKEQAIERTAVDLFTNLALDPKSGIANFILNKRVLWADGTAWGAHENYQTLRRYFNPKAAEEGLLHEQRYRVLAFHFATRGSYAGSGAIRMQADGTHAFVCSQKATALNSTFARGTTSEKPLVNLRDIPYAETENYTRLHVTSGDPSLSPWALKLKVGTTKLILDAMESGYMPIGLPKVRLKPLYKYASQLAYDTTCKTNLDAVFDDVNMSAPDIQQALFAMCLKYVQDQSCPLDDDKWIISNWAIALDTIENDATTLLCADWPQRRKILYDFAEPHNIMRKNSQGKWEPDWSHPRMLALDLKFDQIKDGRSIVTSLRRRPEWAVHMPPGELVERYQSTPPEMPPRAKARGLLINKLANGTCYEYAHIGWATVKLTGYPEIQMPYPDCIDADLINSVLGDEVF